MDMYTESRQEGNMLFCDSVGCPEIVVCEDVATNGSLRFRGKFQEANAVNKNKRMYPYDVLDLNVKRLTEAVGGRGLLGELDHPQDSIIHFDKASHIITKLWWEGNTLMGEGEILPTPHGMILRKLLESGVRVGISSRGVGNGQVNNEGVLVIGESYKLITFDAVADPSTFAAYQKVVATTKHESVASVPASTNVDNGNNLPLKNEAIGINTINKDALIAFTGQLVKKLVKDIKNERFQ